MRRNTGDTWNTGSSNRLRTDHTQTRQGPLSSIKAVIKRTKPSSQSERRRGNYRRRPEITILSAEPLDCSGRSSGNPLVFSAPHTSPPQVPRQKTQEVHIKPIAPPRHLNCKTTTTTTTTATAAAAAAAATTATTETAGKKNLKPPRPSAPKNKISSTATDGPTNVNLTFSSSCSNQDSGFNSGQTNYTGCVTVQWNNTTSTETSSDTTTAFTATTTASSIQYPVPLPRIKSKRLLILPAEPPTLVQLSENSDPSNCSLDRASSNTYLEELLEVFKEENLANFNQTEYVDEMSAANSLRARIQAFENQAEEASVPIKPQPVERKTRPPVVAKPSIPLKPQFSTDDIYENVSSSPPTPAPKPTMKTVGKTNSVKEELDAVLAQHRSKPPKLTREDSIYDDDFAKGPSMPPLKPKEPLRPNLNINNHNNYTAQPLYDSAENVAMTAVSTDDSFSVYEYVDRQSTSGNDFGDMYTFEDDTSQNPETTNNLYEHVEYSQNISNNIPVKPKPPMDNYEGSRQSMTRRPTTIIVPRKSGSFSDGFQDSPPALPVQMPVGALKAPPVNRHSIASFPPQVSHSPAPEPTLPPRRLMTSKTLPPRPPMVRSGPGRPPAPRLEAAGRAHSSPWDSPPKPQKPQKRNPVLPPRPNPGHCLYNKYTLHVPHGVASTDYDGRSTGELSFQKNEVLVLLNPIDSSTYECQVGDRRGRVHRSSMKVITPLSTASDLSETQGGMLTASGNGLTVKALFDFIPENPGELDLRAGDVVTMVEQVDSEWYRGTCSGSTGFFPINYAKVLENSPRLPDRNGRKPSSNVSGPRCVARFDFEGEHSDELSFSEGDVIQLKSYVGQDWARGQLGAFSGIFPLNFVEIIQDLPRAPSPQPTKPNKIALPGMAKTTQNQVTPPAQSPRSGSEWVVALYDFSGNTEGDLSFQAGDRIFVTNHLDEEWSSGRLDGKEGIFPWSFVSNSREDFTG